MPNAPIDDIDEMIVRELRADGRLSIPRLAERVGVSRANAYARFDRLVEDGVITGFTATTDPRSLGLDVAALIQISSDQQHWPRLKQELLAAPGVEWLGMGAGEFDFVALVRARNLDDLRDVVLRHVLAIDGVQSSHTTVLLDESRP